MTKFEVGDQVLVTGPLVLPSLSVEESFVGLIPGEVGRVTKFDPDDVDHLAPRVWGFLSEGEYYIAASSLTPLSEIQDDPETKWGDLLDPDYVHDYVWEGDYE